MGKDKEQKTEAPGNAFSRMNYLYQAAHVMANSSVSNSLSRYYIKVMKEISKKMVEKLHPDLKRTVCCVCNYPLTGRPDQINVKVKPHRKTKRKRKKCEVRMKKESSEVKTLAMASSMYSKARVDVRKKRPNKVLSFCCKCGFSKYVLQKPSYKLWVHEIQDNL